MNDELLRQFHERLLDVEVSLPSSNPSAEVLGKFADNLRDFILYLARNEKLAEVLFAHKDRSPPKVSGKFLKRQYGPLL